MDTLNKLCYTNPVTTIGHSGSDSCLTVHAGISHSENGGHPMAIQVSLKKNFIMNMLLTASSMIFPLITYPYVSRILLPEGMGRVAFVTSVVSYFSMVSSLGIPTYGIRACAQVRDSKEELTRTVHEIFIINACMTLIVYLFFFLAVFFVKQLHQEKALFLICGSTLFFNLIGMEWMYKALEQYQYITIRSVFFKAVSVVLMLATIHSRSDYVLYGALTILAGVGSNIFNFFHARKYISFRPGTKYNFRQHLTPILVFFAFSVATTIYTNLDTAMLGFFKGNIEVGYYNAAVKIKEILVAFVTALGTVMLPRISYYVKGGQIREFTSLVKKAMDFVLFSALPICVYFIFTADNSILFLAGDSFYGAIRPMQLIMPTLICIGITNIIGIQILVPLGKEKLVVLSTCAGAITDLILNALLIPEFAACGAALGTLSAEIIVLAVQLHFIRPVLPDLFEKVQYKKLLPALFLASCALCAVKPLLHMGLFFSLVVTALLFFSVYLLALLLLKYQFPLKKPC